MAERQQRWLSQPRKKEQFITAKRKQWRDNCLGSVKKRRALEKAYSRQLVVGRRAVEIGTIAQHLRCLKCDLPIFLENIEKETRIGLASEFHVRCKNCNNIVQVPTSKTTTKSTKNYPVYDVNLKTALG